MANGGKVMSVRIRTDNVNNAKVTIEIGPITHHFTREEALIIATELKRHAERLTDIRETCPWCGSRNTEASQCLDCKSFSIEYGNIEDATFEELQKGWFKGDDLGEVK